MRAPRVLLLGGSTEASSLARAIDTRRFDLTVSYAGRTRERTATPGTIRVGGFGGVAGLTRYLRDQRVDAVVDATHPFAAHMPHYAATACAAAGVPRVRLCRPAWTPDPGDEWIEVADLSAAAEVVDATGARRVFLTTGRQELEPFAHVCGAWFLVRAIEQPHRMPLASAHVVLARGPFDEADELALMQSHDIDMLVTKNSGGAAAAGKLSAARALGIRVVMVRRPLMPAGAIVAHIADALAWLDDVANAVHAPGYVRGV